MNPIWHDRVVPCGDGHLDRDLDVDVCVIGAGITGITLATELVAAGQRVVVLEMRAVAQGATGHTSGHLTAVPDVRLTTLVRRFGQEGAQEAITGQLDAIDYIERTVDREAIDCGFERVPGYRFVDQGKSAADLVEDVACARTLGIPDAALVEGPAPFIACAAMFPRQAVFHPVAYVCALAQRARANGVAIYEGTRVVRIEEASDGCTVTCTNHHTVRARAVVHATHTPVGLVVPMQTRIAPYQTYCLAFQRTGDVLPDALMWDTEEPYHYLRPLRRAERDLLIVGGEDHKTGQEPDPEARYRRLERWARDRFEVGSVVSRWSWPVFEPVDGLPYIGRLGAHRAIYVATGFAGNGLTFGTVAALTLTRMLLGEPLETSVFRPQRYKPLDGAQRFVGEAANVAAHLVADRVSRPEAPICPHLGGVLQWNAAELTWDCPLHGSRFLANGKVLCGPATADLVAADVDVALASTTA